jgi:hypothetical protein
MVAGRSTRSIGVTEVAKLLWPRMPVGQLHRSAALRVDLGAPIPQEGPHQR